MLWLLLYCIALYLTCRLGKHCLPPIIAGATGIVLGEQTHDIKWAVLMGVSLYITCFMSNSIPQAAGYSTGNEVLGVLDELSEENAGRLYVYRAAAIILFFWLSIPSAPAQIPWYVSLPIGTLLLTINSNKDSNWIVTSIYIVVQTLSLSLCCWVATQLGWAINPVTGVICALALPRFLFKTERLPQETSNRRLFYFPYIGAMLSLFIVWLTPGFSVTVISNTFFKRGAIRSVMQGFLEGAVEGYVLSLMARGYVSGKSTWGDLLQTPILNWGSFTPTNTIGYILMFSILLGVMIPVISVQFEQPTNPKHFRYYTIIFIVGQAVIDVDYLLPLFVLVGLALYKLRECWDINEESSSLGLLSVLT